MNISKSCLLNSFLKIINIYKNNKCLLIVKLIPIIIFTCLLFTNIDSLIIENFVENNSNYINESFISSQHKNNFIDKWNLINAFSSGHIDDIIIENNRFVFVVSKDTDHPSNYYNVSIPENEDAIIREYIEEMTIETAQLSLAIIFPTVFGAIKYLRNKIMKLSKAKNTIYINEILTSFISLAISLLCFRFLLFIYVHNWDNSVKTIPLILMFITLISFIKETLLKVDEEKTGDS